MLYKIGNVILIYFVLNKYLVMILIRFIYYLMMIFKVVNLELGVCGLSVGSKFYGKEIIVKIFFRGWKVGGK